MTTAKRTYRSIVILLISLFIGFGLSAQNPSTNLQGIPFVKSFGKELYKAGIQNWAIAQDQAGIILIANNDGLLVNNGANWATYYLPNRTLARSIAVGSGNKIYVGGQNEFGYFKSLENGEYIFTSLSDEFEEEYRDFEDVWDIQIVDESVFFRSSSRIYELSPYRTKVYAEHKVNFLTKSENSLYAQTNDNALLQYSNGDWQRVPNFNVPSIVVKGILPIDKSQELVLSQDDGLFVMSKESFKPFESTANDLLKEVKGISLEKISENSFAIGTALAGVILINDKGEIISRIGREEGLLSNKAQALYVDEAYNLWVGMNKGIGLIYTNSPFTRISPDKAHEGIGYGASVLNNHLYLATDNGLYVKDLKEKQTTENLNKYTMIPDTDGQAWGLCEVQNNLFLTHNRGAYKIENTEAEMIISGTGSWLFQKDQYFENRLIIGGYDGISYTDYNSTDIGNLMKQNDLLESSRFIEQEEGGVIWMSHPYRGIYKVDRKNNSVKKYGKANGLPSDLHNHTFEVNNKIVFCGETGIYTYDNTQEKFESYFELASHFDPNEKIRRLYSGPNRDIWFITSKEVGVLKIVNKGLELEVSKQTFPFLKTQMNDGFENIYIHEDDNVIISTTKGFIHYDKERAISGQAPHTLMLSAVCQGVRGAEDVYQNTSNVKGLSTIPLELSVGYDQVNFYNFKSIYQSRTW